MRFGTVEFTLENLSESDEYLKGVIESHTPADGREFCDVCSTRAPCDVIYLAASGLYRSKALQDVTDAFVKHRTATHITKPHVCLTCQDSDEAIRRARSVIQG